MPDWLSWGNVSSCRLLRRHVFRVIDMIGHQSAGAADEVASCLAHMTNTLHHNVGGEHLQRIALKPRIYI